MHFFICLIVREIRCFSISGPFERFIWYNWVKDTNANLTELEEKFVFNGKIKGFKHLHSNISHQRIVTKVKGINEWIIKDIVSGVKNITSYL